MRYYIQGKSHSQQSFLLSATSVHTGISSGGPSGQAIQAQDYPKFEQSFLYQLISFTIHNYLKTLIVMLPNCILNYTILYLEVLTRHTLDSNPGSATGSFLLFASVYVNRHITLLQLVQADVGWVDGCRLVAHPFQKSDIYKSQLSVTTYHRFEQFISEFSTNKSSVIQTLDIWTTALDECPFI